MTDSVVIDNSTPRRHCKISIQEHSFSSQESNNCDRHPVLRYNKNLESKDGSHSPPPISSNPGKFPSGDEIVPLSGNPFFTCILAKTQVQAPYQLSIPTSFYSFLPSTCVPVVLSYRNKEWGMRYHGDRSQRQFDKSWRCFATDNKLKIGDGCVFELMDTKDLRFEVQILRGEPPNMNIYADSGQSSDHPICVD